MASQTAHGASDGLFFRINNSMDYSSIWQQLGPLLVPSKTEFGFSRIEDFPKWQGI
jgi:hypothetical protein